MCACCLVCSCLPSSSLIFGFLARFVCQDVEFQLKEEEVILGRQPRFGEWVENALEEYLVEVDVKSKETIYQQIVGTVRSATLPQVERMEGLETLDEKQKAFDDLLRSIGSLGSQLSKNKNNNLTNLGRHPLFAQLVARAFEECLSNLRGDAEKELYNRVAESVRSKLDSNQLKNIFELSSEEEKTSAIDELSAAIVKDQLQKERFDSKRYNFLRWVKRLHDDSLYQQVAAVVRAEASSLPLDKIQDLVAQKRVIDFRSKILKQKFVKDEFPLSKHDTFLNWIKRALEECIDGSRNDLFEQVAVKVIPKAEDGDELDHIKALESVADKWVALDELSRTIQEELVTERFALAEHYQFDLWVKRALKEHMQELQILPKTTDGFLEGRVSAPLDMVKRAIEEQLIAMREPDPTADYPTKEQDEKSVPIFMDCYGPGCTEEQNVPDILKPLRFYPRAKGWGQGKMLEEWELSADKETKRIMLRESTRRIAQLVEKGETTPQRVLVHGRRGVGKTAALAAIVASARKSGHLVHYVPDCRMLYEHGYYNIPNKKREGIFDLPILSKKQCMILLETHRTDLEKFSASRNVMEKYFSDTRMEKVGDSTPLIEVLELGVEKEPASAGAYSCVLEVLMTQEEQPFTMIVDEFNVFFGQGQYYNMEYKEEVRDQDFIPYPQISLFEPIMKAAGLTINIDAEEVLTPVLMKKGTIVCATTESHAVPQRAKDLLMENAQRATREPTAPLEIVEIPRLSKLEVEHMLSNYESTGMGKLRMDEGATVSNPQEVEYLRMVSSSIPLNLMNVCIE